MVCTCFTFTKPRTATSASVAVSMTIIRFHMSASPNGVDDDAAVDAVAVPRVLSEERGRIVLRPRRDEPVIGTHAPAVAAVEPLHARADVACQKRVGLRDSEPRRVEDCQAADTAGHVRRERRGGGDKQATSSKTS